jgi:hypothetical protein
MTHDQKQEMVL